MGGGGASWFLEHPGRPMLSQWMVDSKGRGSLLVPCLSHRCTVCAIFGVLQKRPNDQTPLKSPH